jgi:Ran GTPase-activating protein (RanGAP) involved in mRNA processing and transport
MSGIPMTDSMTDELVLSVNHNSFIGRIALQNNALSSQSLQKLFALLLTNPKLTNLDVSENDVDDNSVLSLSNILQLLPPNRDPISLILRDNSFGPVGAGYLATALAHNSPVRWLDLRNNPSISDRGVEQLALSLSQNTSLVGIDLIKCGCDEFGTTALADSLIENHTLTTLLLQDKLSLIAIQSLSFLVSDPACKLTGLYLWHCGLNSPEKIECLCCSLKSNKTINTLGLSYNEIDDVGGSKISDMIFKNCAISKLHLGANNFHLATAGFFGVALSQNSTLQYLDLSRNYLCSSGVWALAVSLWGNCSLRSIDLRHNGIDAEGAEMLCELMAGNSGITTMRLSGNPFGNDAVKKIAECLEGNKTLKEIELNDVNLTEDGFVVLCRALERNETLEKLSVSENRIGGSGMKAFGKLLKVT